MQLQVTTSPIDALIQRLHNNKHYCEFRMTKDGFTKGGGKFYDPTELTLVNIYPFGDDAHPGELSFVYILRDKDGKLGFSVDAIEDYSKNEATLYHWFITKMAKDLNAD